MGFAWKIYVLNLQVALLPSAAGGDVAAARGETGALDDTTGLQLSVSHSPAILVQVTGRYRSINHTEDQTGHTEG